MLMLQRSDLCISLLCEGQTVTEVYHLCLQRSDLCMVSCYRGRTSVLLCSVRGRPSQRFVTFAYRVLTEVGPLYCLDAEQGVLYSELAAFFVKKRGYFVFLKRRGCLKLTLEVNFRGQFHVDVTEVGPLYCLDAELAAFFVKEGFYFISGQSAVVDFDIGD